MKRTKENIIRVANWLECYSPDHIAYNSEPYYCIGGYLFSWDWGFDKSNLYEDMKPSDFWLPSHKTWKSMLEFYYKHNPDA